MLRHLFNDEHEPLKEYLKSGEDYVLSTLALDLFTHYVILDSGAIRKEILSLIGDLLSADALQKDKFVLDCISQYLAEPQTT